MGKVLWIDSTMRSNSRYAKPTGSAKYAAIVVVKSLRETEEKSKRERKRDEKIESQSLL